MSENRLKPVGKHSTPACFCYLCHLSFKTFKVDGGYETKTEHSGGDSGSAIYSYVPVTFVPIVL